MCISTNIWLVSSKDFGKKIRLFLPWKKKKKKPFLAWFNDSFAVTMIYRSVGCNVDKSFRLVNKDQSMPRCNRENLKRNPKVYVLRPLGKNLFWRLFKFILAWSIFKFTTREENWADFRNLVHLSAICQEPNQLVEILLKVSEPHHWFLPYSAVSFWNFDKLLCYLHGLVPLMVRLSLPKLGEGSITRLRGML